MWHFFNFSSQSPRGVSGADKTIRPFANRQSLHLLRLRYTAFDIRVMPRPCWPDYWMVCLIISSTGSVIFTIGICLISGCCHVVSMGGYNLIIILGFFAGANHWCCTQKRLKKVPDKLEGPLELLFKMCSLSPPSKPIHWMAIITLNQKKKIMVWKLANSELGRGGIDWFKIVYLGLYSSLTFLHQFARCWRHTIMFKCTSVWWYSFNLCLSGRECQYYASCESRFKKSIAELQSKFSYKKEALQAVVSECGYERWTSDERKIGY